MINGLLKIQQELKVPKDRNNEYGGFKYRSSDDILEKAKPLLEKYNLLLTITDKVVNVGEANYIKATATITDGEKTESASAYAREKMDHKKMDEGQLTGSASSYARKYALGGLFLLDDGQDSDSLNIEDSISKNYETRAKQSVNMITEKQIKKIQAVTKNTIGRFPTKEAMESIKKLTKKQATDYIDELPEKLEKQEEEIDIDDIELGDNEN